MGAGWSVWFLFVVFFLRTLPHSEELLSVSLSCVCAHKVTWGGKKFYFKQHEKLELSPDSAVWRDTGFLLGQHNLYNPACC